MVVYVTLNNSDRTGYMVYGYPFFPGGGGGSLEHIDIICSNCEITLLDQAFICFTLAVEMVLFRNMPTDQSIYSSK